MENNTTSKNIFDIDINNYENDINDILDKTIEITNLIDKKSLEITDVNNNNNNKILQYKLLLENVILEYHKICKELYKNN